MTYSAGSPILGNGTVAAEAIDAWLQSRAVGGAAFVKLPQVPIPADMGRIIVEECARYPQAMVNHDLVAAQIAHESASCQSKIARDKRNYCGYGAENDDPYGKAHTFATARAGVRTQVAHLLGYVVGDGPWNADSPRYSIVKARDWDGKVRVLRDLEQRWAYTEQETYDETDPSERYGQKVADAANVLIAFANHGTWGQEPPMTTVPKPYMNTSRPSPNRGGYDPAEDGPRVPEAIVNHIATSSKASNLNWLTNPASGASCNYYIAKDGEIFELVPWQFAAWTNGDVNKPDMSNPLIKRWIENGWNPNTRTITVEHEGEAADALTEAQIASNNALTAWLSQVANIALSRTTVLGHYQINSVNRPYCPSFSDVEWARLIGGALALLLHDENENLPDKLVLPGQDKLGEFYAPTAGFVLGFKDVVEDIANGRFPDDPVKAILTVIGYPKEDEWQGIDGCSYQRCARVTLQYIPDEADNPPYDIVTLQPDTPLPARKPAA